MSRRHKMSKRNSRKSFRKYSGTHKRNRGSYVTRGGIRL